MATKHPPYLRVIGPNDPPPEPEAPQPLGEDDAALILRGAYGDPTCEVVFGWEPKDSSAEVLFVLQRLMAAVQKSQEAGEKPRNFFLKLKSHLTQDDE